MNLSGLLLFSKEKSNPGTITFETQAGHLKAYITTMTRFWCFVWLAQAYATNLYHPDIRAIFTSPGNKWSPGTVISFPGSEAFDNATSRWTITDAPSFSAAISPINEVDVANAVSNQGTMTSYDQDGLC